MEDEKKRYYRIVMAVWDFIKGHLDQDKNEAYWERCVNDVRELIQNSYPEDMEILTKMINAVLGDLQERDKT